MDSPTPDIDQNATDIIANAPTPTLQGIPTEIRRQIFDEVVTNSNCVFRGNYLKLHQALTISSVNKTFHAEIHDRLIEARDHEARYIVYKEGKWGCLFCVQCDVLHSFVYSWHHELLDIAIKLVELGNQSYLQAVGWECGPDRYSGGNERLLLFDPSSEQGQLRIKETVAKFNLPRDQCGRFLW